MNLVPLPPQPEGAAWPTAEWPEGPLPSGVELDPVLAWACDDSGPLATTFAVVVLHHGRIVAERYHGHLEFFDRASEAVTALTPLLSWSMAKSMLHAVVGQLVGDGLLNVHAPADVPEWSSPGDPVVSGLVGPGPSYLRFLRQRLFDRIGMRSAMPEFDAAGTWVASSYVRATARDFARFGLLYLRDGVWNGTRLLPEGWVDYGRTIGWVDPEDGPYGAHWWGVAGDTFGTFRASGYEGQSITICPALDLVVVRLGKTAAGHAPDLTRWRADMVRAFSRARES